MWLKIKRQPSLDTPTHPQDFSNKFWARPSDIKLMMSNVNLYDFIKSCCLHTQQAWRLKWSCCSSWCLQFGHQHLCCRWHHHVMWQNWCFSLALFKPVYCMREQHVSVPTNWVGEKWEGVHVWGDCCPAADPYWNKRRGGTCRENTRVAVTRSWCWGVGSRLGAEVVGLHPQAAAPSARSGWSPTQHWPTVVHPRTHRRRTSQSPRNPLALPATKW